MRFPRSQGNRALRQRERSSVPHEVEYRKKYGTQHYLWHLRVRKSCSDCEVGSVEEGWEWEPKQSELKSTE